MAALPQIGDHAPAVRVLLVLAKLSLAFQPHEFDLDADGLRHPLGQIVLRRVCHPPGILFARFVVARQQRQDAANELFLVHDAHRSVSVDDLIVPRGNLAMRLVLRRIPVRRHIGMRAAEDRHDGGAGGAALPQRIGARDMGEQHAGGAGGRVEFERNMVRLQARFAVRHQDAEGVVANNPVQVLGTGLREVLGDMHGGYGVVGPLTVPPGLYNKKCRFSDFFMGQFSSERRVGTRGAERRIYRMLRSQIEEGLLAEGARLISTRALAAELGVSRTTVTAAYEQLAAEGFVVTAAGRAARVAGPMSLGARRPNAAPTTRRDAPPPLSLYGQRVAAMSMHSVSSPLTRIDFKYGAVASRDFPALGWQRAYRAELLRLTKTLYYTQPEGEERLRKALQGYLRRARGLTCDAEQILVVHGSQQGLDLCARLLLNPGDAFVFEEPGYRVARHCFEATGAKIVATPVDGSGLDTARLPETGRVRLAYVTPSHQFPMGGVLPIARRLELLEWANRHGAWVVEDDYGGEFRYGQRPIDALQSMDAEGRVIYVGKFSKALSPQLRLGYLVLPRELVAVFREAKRLTDRHSPLLEQNVLASLIESGAYERHVRRMRRENERRRKALLDAVDQHLAGRGHLVGTAAGLHAVLVLPAQRAEDEIALQAAALERGIGVYPISPLFAHAAAATEQRSAGLILGYAGLTPKEIYEGINIVAAAIRALGARKAPRARRSRTA